MMKMTIFDKFVKRNEDHKFIMREAAEEAARLLQSIVAIKKWI